MAIAQEPSKWTMPLGVNADANTIPDTAPEYTGNASMNSVFPSITQLPLEAGGIAPTRADFNGLFKLIGASIYYLQRGGIFSYADDADYPIGAVVKFENGIYIAIQENGPTGTVADPSVPDYWRHLTTTVNDQYADSNGNVSITSVANATNNANGKELVNSIIKGLSVSDATITYTKIDGNTGTIKVNNVASADNGVDSYGGNWIRFKCGVQICWGGFINSSITSFGKAFKSQPNVTVSHLTGVDAAVVATITVLNGYGLGVKLTFLNGSDVGGNVQYIAIGTWK